MLRQTSSDSVDFLNWVCTWVTLCESFLDPSSLCLPYDSTYRYEHHMQCLSTCKDPINYIIRWLFYHWWHLWCNISNYSVFTKNLNHFLSLVYTGKQRLAQCTDLLFLWYDRVQPLISTFSTNAIILFHQKVQFIFLN